MTVADMGYETGRSLTVGGSRARSLDCSWSQKGWHWDVVSDNSRWSRACYTAEELDCLACAAAVDSCCPHSPRGFVDHIP
jgi:hypothetical protein